jgi:hypothetical protein
MQMPNPDCTTTGIGITILGKDDISPRTLLGLKVDLILTHMPIPTLCGGSTRLVFVRPILIPVGGELTPMRVEDGHAGIGAI